jgi:hypothetical protein
MGCGASKKEGISLSPGESKKEERISLSNTVMTIKYGYVYLKTPCLIVRFLLCAIVR